MSKLPAFQFYPADWRKSPDIQAMSFFDRGVWFEILCLMHESEDRGRLLLSGRPMNNDALARILGLSKSKLEKTLTTILDFGVAMRDADGVLCNRRMMRDERLRQVRTEVGKLGGNPNLVNQNTTKEVNQKPTPSSSSSSSSSSTEEKNKNTTTTASKISDDEWLDSLQTNPAYKLLQVRTEYARAIVWAETNNRQCTRRFFVNWLNRAKPMGTASPKRSQVGKETRTPGEIAAIAIEPPCDICGKEICFSNHYEEIAA